MTLNRHLIAAAFVLVLIGMSGIVVFQMGYYIGYDNGKWEIIGDTIEHQRTLSFWANGGFLNTTMYNYSWYTFGPVSQAPTLGNDSFIILVMIEVKFQESGNWSIFDIHIETDYHYHNCTIERVHGYTPESFDGHYLSGSRSFDYMIPENTTGYMNVYSCHGIVSVFFFGHGSSSLFDTIATRMIDVSWHLP